MLWTSLLRVAVVSTAAIWSTAGALSAQFGGAGQGQRDNPFFAPADQVVAIHAGRLFDGTSSGAWIVGGLSRVPRFHPPVTGGVPCGRQIC